MLAFVSFGSQSVSSVSIWFALRGSPSSLASPLAARDRSLQGPSLLLLNGATFIRLLRPGSRAALLAAPPWRALAASDRGWWVLLGGMLRCTVLLLLLGKLRATNKSLTATPSCRRWRWLALIVPGRHRAASGPAGRSRVLHVPSGTYGVGGWAVGQRAAHMPRELYH